MGAAGGASAFLAVVAEPRLELGPEGGGDFNRGDIGHCGGVVSPLAPVLLFCLDALPASFVPPPGRAGTFAADSALWIAAAEGCVDIGVVRGCGLLSFRVGDAFLDVRGLVPAEAEGVVTSPPDNCFLSGGGAAVVGVGACDGGFLVSLVLRRGAELLAVVMPAASEVSAWPVVEAEVAPESCCSGLLLAMVSGVRARGRGGRGCVCPSSR